MVTAVTHFTKIILFEKIAPIKYEIIFRSIKQEFFEDISVLRQSINL